MSAEAEAFLLSTGLADTGYFGQRV